MKIGKLIVVSVVLGVVAIGGFIGYKEYAFKKEQAESERLAKIHQESEKMRRVIELQGVLAYLNQLHSDFAKAVVSMKLAGSVLEIQNLTKSNTSELPKVTATLRDVQKLVEMTPEKGCVTPAKQRLQSGIPSVIEAFDLIALSQESEADEKMKAAKLKFAEYNELHDACLKATTDELRNIR